MTTDSRSERELAEQTLFAKVSPAVCMQLLSNRLRNDVTLIQSLFGGRALTHMEACRSIVALSGLQILRDAKLREAIVGEALPEQVIRCFDELLASRDSIRSSVDYEIDEMRAEVARHAWHSGSLWARLFCDAFELPAVLAGRDVGAGSSPYELVEPLLVLPPLHDFQVELKQRIEDIVSRGEARRCLVALPTGAGKTRMLVDTSLELEEVAHGRRCIVWIAQHEELCEQAVQCFTQGWKSRHQPDNRELLIQRVWKNLNDEINWDADIIVGIPESLIPRLQRVPASSRARVALTVIDEAHHALAPSYQAIFSLLGGSPIVGITATPAATLKAGTDRLRRRFGNELLTSQILGPDPVQELQLREILAIPEPEEIATECRVDSDLLDAGGAERFGDLPAALLDRLGNNTNRNKKILARLLDLDENEGSVLCFAASVASARAIAASLVVAGRSASCIDATTEKWNRSETVSEFRSGKIQFLVNYGVLATGFDAPKVNILVLSRPTTSPVLFEQMIGRGLRGPLNGGTRTCKIIHFADDFTQFGGVRPLSYARFLDQ